MNQVVVIVGENIRKYRKEKGLTQERLADEAGISSEYVSRLEHAKENPTVELLVKLCNVLSITIVQLFEREVLGKSKKEKDKGEYN